MLSVHSIYALCEKCYSSHEATDDCKNSHCDEKVYRCSCMMCDACKERASTVHHLRADPVKVATLLTEDSLMVVPYWLVVENLVFTHFACHQKKLHSLKPLKQKNHNLEALFFRVTCYKDTTTLTRLMKLTSKKSLRSLIKKILVRLRWFGKNG